MSRLTFRKGGNTYFTGEQRTDKCGDFFCKHSRNRDKIKSRECIMLKAIDTLAEYEDTGLNPAEVAELTQGKADGRLVGLPCRVGDTVYTNMQFSGSYLRQKDKPYPVEIVFIGLNDDVAIGGGFFNITYSTGHMWQFNFSDIGKTVFLTKAQAELERVKGNKV